MLYYHIPVDNRNLLTMVDHLSKFGWIVSITNKISWTVLDVIQLWFALHGISDSLQSDNDTEFVNTNLSLTWKGKSKSFLSLHYHPQSQDT